MNILPKKSWHVLSKDNIERVRRDEEKAAAEEKEKQRRIALAEQEARTAHLREKARKRHGRDEPTMVDGADSSIVATTEATELRHPNFFSEIEEGKKTVGVNKEHEEEKRKEKEKYEKSIGLLTYLGQSSAEAKDAEPWYFKSPSKRKKCEEGEDDSTVDRKRKDTLDPLKDMDKYLRKKHKHKHKHKKEKESKERHKHAKADKKTPTIEQLRAERLQRERAERAKANKLLSGESSHSKETVNTDDRTRRYNSQYNPHLVRKLKYKGHMWNME
ncbi:leukocyte receptor cluster member 1 homolog [Saccoglossus kowalevskii]|uniref:Leukocyte receptor cluster member 1 homolog n=1 Tax=Saccoglossus kowalevskii TaxID=10224 RepID=A0ABM0H0R4_SACKO|nr:PREDICTED: leukocyte receptor cluster member 1 homolog [Saccoglossus kowalevskii]